MSTPFGSKHWFSGRITDFHREIVIRSQFTRSIKLSSSSCLVNGRAIEAALYNPKIFARAQRTESPMSLVWTLQQHQIVTKTFIRIMDTRLIQPLIYAGRGEANATGNSRARCGPAPAAASASPHLSSLSTTAPKIVYATAAGGGHDMPGHAECAARVPAILNALETAGFSDNPQILQLTDYDLAQIADLAPVHNLKYLTALDKLCTASTDVAYNLVDPAPTYITQTSYLDCLRAAGATMALVDRVVASSMQQAQIGFAICRPPGHHAVPAGPMGFCLMNNAAVAARHAQRRHGLQRIAIVDFDVHHGNGTQDVFYDDPTVLFISAHQSGSYPNTGKANETGQGDGEGTTINIPLPGLAGHAAACQSFEEIVLPALHRFSPDMIIVSAGYDAHWKDPLAGLQFRSGTYHWLAQQLHSAANSLCSGRIVFVLEGGYDLMALGESVACTFAGLLDCSVDCMDSVNASHLLEEPRDKVATALLEVKRIHEMLT